MSFDEAKKAVANDGFAWNHPVLYTDTTNGGTQTCRDDLWAIPTADLAMTITCPSKTGGMTVISAREAVRGTWKDFEDALIRTGYEPVFRRLPAIALTDLPFTGLEPDVKP